MTQGFCRASEIIKERAGGTIEEGVSMSQPVQIVEYDPRWPMIFGRLAAVIRDGLGPLVLRIEHVGSTAVPGLPAKPIVDMDAVIPVGAAPAEAIAALRPLGYTHEGDLGIAGREAFTSPEGAPAHHLYVCAADSPELARHLAFRDFLRAHPESARRYGELKWELAARHRDDRSAYTVGKSVFIENALAEAHAEARRSAGQG
ncbi:GrpB family protein [Streptomyces sp. NPDC058000]|uniref:GrpB family protein n=1 Tax=Streptomyces sp. NPDC058000 TaxID=3346299 RepID=UPI0036E4E069